MDAATVPSLVVYGPISIPGGHYDCGVQSPDAAGDLGVAVAWTEQITKRTVTETAPTPEQQKPLEASAKASAGKAKRKLDEQIQAAKDLRQGNSTKTENYYLHNFKNEREFLDTARATRIP
eukprot:SAG22_NODE_2164_length_2909_cov_2.567260_3_plen_121_part_00